MPEPSIVLYTIYNFLFPKYHDIFPPNIIKDSTGGDANVFVTLNTSN